MIESNDRIEAKIYSQRVFVGEFEVTLTNERLYSLHVLESL
jgi:hypothetical protein